MGKKLILVCIAVVVLAAFALPSTASAKPRICETNGSVCETLATGVKWHVHGTIGGLWISLNPFVLCVTVTITGTLTKNNAEAVEGTAESASFTGSEAEGKCKGELGAGPTRVTMSPAAGEEWKGTPYCLKASGTEDKFTIRGGACNEASRAITIVLHTTNFGTCRYTRSNAIEGTFTTHTSSSETAVLSVARGSNSEFTKEAPSGVLCPNTSTLEMQAKLTTDNSPTFTPLYIENV